MSGTIADWVTGVSAVGALVVSIINSIKSDKIHILVNSNLARVKNDLAAANRLIRQLTKLKRKPKR